MQPRHFTECVSDGKPIQINNSDTTVDILVRHSQLREKLIHLLLTQMLQLYRATETVSLQSQSDPAWLDFVALWKRECVVLQESPVVLRALLPLVQLGHLKHFFKLTF